MPIKIWKHLKYRLFEDRITNGPAKGLATSQPFENQNPDIFVWISNGFCQDSVPICPDLKWLGFRLSDPIGNLDHWQTNLFLTILTLDFRSPLYFSKKV